MKKLLKQALLFGFAFALVGVNHSAKAGDFEVASYINDKVDETIASPVRRMRYKASSKIQSIKSRFSNHSRRNSNSEEREEGTYTARSNYRQGQTNSVVLSKPDNNFTSIQPEISSPRSSGQYEAQIDEMVLAQWQRPSKVSPADWEQILISVKRVSKKTGIPQQLIMSLVNKESGFNPEIVSRSGAIGLTQIMPVTGQSECGLSKGDLYDIDKNLNCGITYLDKQLKYFKRIDLAVAAYNAGPGAVRRAIEKAGTDNIHSVTALLKPETAPYVRKILASINYNNDFI